MMRYFFAALFVVVFCLDAVARPRGAALDVFNGGKSQVNFNFLLAGGAFPFIDYMKTAQTPSNVNSVPKGMPANKFNSNGYPLSTLFSDPDNFGGVSWLTFIPTTANYSGQWVVAAVGTCTVTLSGGGTLSGLTPTSISFVNGGNQRTLVSFTTTAALPSLTVAITATDAATPCTKLSLYRLDEETDYLAGTVYSSIFKAKLAQGNFGVLRFLNWQGDTSNGVNNSNVALWSHRKPTTFICYECQEYRGSVYAETTNSGDDYSATIGTGAPTDKQLVQVRWNATAATTSATFNLNGTGAVSLKDPRGNPLGTNNNDKPASGRIATMIYNSTLNAWIKWGGDADFRSWGINSGVPEEILFQLAVEMRAHPYFVTPYLATPTILNPATDWLTNLATYVKANSPPWMVPRYEVIPNEIWNTPPANGYGAMVANAIWASPSPNNFYGMVGSVAGQALSSIYSNDRTKYWAISGVQQARGLSPTDFDALLNAPLYVANNGGSAAYNWVTHIAPSTYFGATMSDSQELAAAYAYSQGDGTQPGLFVASTAASLASCPANTGRCNSGSAVKQLYYSGFYNWAQAFPVPVKMTSYEGWWSPDYFDSDTSASRNTVAGNSFSPTVTAITNAVKAKVTLNANSAVPVAGMTMRLLGVVGMTQINGNDYIVDSVSGQDVTLLVDSTGFSAYTSGGTGVYVGAQLLRNNLRQASKSVSALQGYSITNMNNFTGVGANASFPSLFNFSGNDVPPPTSNGSVWSALAPNIYAPASPGWLAFIQYNTN